ncbi:MAG: hypothetical protein HY649_02330 [Acidobacteria bacterium]|nr:hypothetical protein [Acidobacteriota bacterium]
MARRCWAACLSECSGGFTGEHLVTKKLFKGKAITVKGSPWCRQIAMSIGKENFTSNALCKKHNNGLSPVDQAGIDAFAVFRRLAELDEQRIQAMKAAGSPLPFDVMEHTVDGPMIERWFLKTLINLEVVGKQGIPIGPYQNNASEPPQELVEIAFGQKQFENGAGLYTLSREGQDIYLVERVTCILWIHDSGHGMYIAATEFWFYGYTFFLNLAQKMLPQVFQLGDAEVNLRYRPMMIPCRLYGKLSQRINCMW